jgi:hypothetical protein
MGNMVINSSGSPVRVGAAGNPWIATSPPPPS